MTKDELNQALLVERFQPRQPTPKPAPREPEIVVWDDSQITVARRIRELETDDPTHFYSPVTTKEAS